MRTTGGAADKVDFISGAYSQMRISGLTVDPTPEDLELALERLETMAAEFHSRNMCANYNFEDEPDPNSQTNVPRQYWQAFQTNLAIRLIPDFNKQVPDELKTQARQSASNLSGRSALERLNQVQYPSRMARGSGNTLRYNRWQRFYHLQQDAPNACSTNEMTINDVNDFTEHFDSYLNTGEVIESFTIEADSGLRIVSSENNTPDIDYRIEAVNNSSVGEHQRVKIEILTDEARVETRIIDFDVQTIARIRD